MKHNFSNCNKVNKELQINLITKRKTIFSNAKRVLKKPSIVLNQLSPNETLCFLNILFYTKINGNVIRTFRYK